MNLRRAEAVDIHLRKVPLDVAQQFFVPLDLEIGMQAALHQNLIAAQIDGFLDFFQQHVAIEHVAFFVLRLAVEGAEIADGGADVRVVDVAIDVVGAIRLGMKPPRDRVGRPAQRGQIVRFEQAQALGRRQSLAGDGLFQQWFDRTMHRAHLPTTKREALATAIRHSARPAPDRARPPNHKIASSRRVRAVRERNADCRAGRKRIAAR